MKNKTFEEYLKELDNILKTLEDKNVSLEEAVKGYTTGLELSNSFKYSSNVLFFIFNHLNNFTD